jgi:hypothetical protein
MLMQFGKFVFKENPVKLNVKYGRKLILVNIPEIGELAQNRGKVARIVSGEGIFFGSNAFEEFEKLVTLFDTVEESKMLVLPDNEMFWGYFSKLSLNGEGANKVKYSFEFVEDCLKKLDE